MGAVYRATDTSLSRQVAIKVLPDAFAQDAERLARFEREAKTLATLNHPNISAIYAIEKSAGVTALVMELVEGDDLPRRIAQGAIPIDEALPIAKQIAEALEADEPGSFALSPDGRQIVFVDADQTSHRWPQFLPDGRHFLFTPQGTPDRTGIYLGTLGGGAPIRLTPADSPGVFLPTTSGALNGAGVPRQNGWLLWRRAGTLVAQRLDVETAALSGEAVALAELLDEDSQDGRTFSASATGLLAYRIGQNRPRQLTWTDRSGTTRGTVGDPDHTMANPRVSPDGRRVAVSRAVQGNQDIWLLSGMGLTRLTFDPAGDTLPIWSPDGSRIAYRSSRAPTKIDLYEKLASGVGEETPLVASDQPKDAHQLVGGRPIPLVSQQRSPDEL